MNCTMCLKEKQGGGELIYLYDENTNSKQLYPPVTISRKNVLTTIQYTMYVGKWWMYSVVAQKLLQKGDNEDLKTMKKYIFHGIPMRH